MRTDQLFVNMEQTSRLNKLGFRFCEKSNSKENRRVKLAKAGDRNAFAQLYDQYMDAIYRFIYARVSGKMVVEDLTSQVFLKAWENIASFQERGLPFRAWLYRIARNTVIDHYRTAKFHDSIELLPTDEPALNVNAEDHLELHFEEEELVEAMEQLTEDQRQAIRLKFLEGLSTQEVADEMGKRKGAIRALQMRGLQTLSKILKVT
jgi:RNA polymerase sigma-70 factor, ECF subfamily